MHPNIGQERVGDNKRRKSRHGCFEVILGYLSVLFPIAHTKVYAWRGSADGGDGGQDEQINSRATYVERW